jgi:predicted Rossmann fold flavoprotein
MPYKLYFDLCPSLTNLQEDLNTNPHKEIKNILGKYLPQKVVSYILKDLDETTKAHNINGKARDLILERIHNFEVNIISTNKGEETVTAGGIDLNEINPKTMGVKKVPNLYAIGEVLNIDGFCGGFNLQNAWSTAYICANSINQA